MVYIGVVKKSVAVFKRFFLQLLKPHFRIPEHYDGKRKMSYFGKIQAAEDFY